MEVGEPDVSAAVERLRQMAADEREKLATLRRRHDEYIARLKAAGNKVITVDLPCGHQTETPAAPEGEVWDTLSTCQHCGALYMKITSGDRVDALEY